MSYDNNEANVTGWVVGAIIAGLILIAAGMAGCPAYHVYSQRMEGAAMLAHAQSSKEIAVAEAKAKMESASMLASAEVFRAQGVALANKIIGDSLRDNEAYLRYLWITDVAGANVQKTTVYVPTEGNLPILEAGRFHETEHKK